MERGPRLHSIEALRGLAALSVVWFHLTNQFHGLVASSGAYGWLGVDVFFVISGFVIPYSLHKSGHQLRDFPRFLMRRVLRLEPPYIASIALVVVLQFASNMAPGFEGLAPAYSTPQLLSHLLYLIPLTAFSWVQPVYWSLAYEFAFYIVAGLTFTAIWPRNIAYTFALAGLAVLAKFAAAGMWDARIVLFVLGIAAARRHVGRDSLGIFAMSAGAGVAAMLAMRAPESAVAGLLAALVIAFVRLPRWRILAGLGAISYSLYLTHVPIGGRVVNLGKRFGQGPIYDLALLLLALAICLIFAWVFYRAFEVAATRWSRHFGAGRQASPLDAYG